MPRRLRPPASRTPSAAHLEALATTSPTIIDRDDVAVEEWTCRHFSLGNPLDERPTDLPHLLRRVAERIEAEGITAMQLHDVTISEEMTEHGPWWRATVYWTPEEPPAEPHPR